MIQLSSAAMAITQLWISEVDFVFFQWTVCGLAGHPGHSARQPAVVDTTCGRAHAQTPPPPMEGTSAWGCTPKRLSATPSPAQVGCAVTPV